MLVLALALSLICALGAPAFADFMSPFGYVQVNPDGSRVLYLPDGSYMIQYPDGSIVSCDPRTGETSVTTDGRDMYGFVPPYSDLIREYFLSEPGNSCLGILWKNGEPGPIFDSTPPNADALFAFHKIADGSLQFLHDFVKTFSCFKELLFFDAVAVSMPFEGMIHSSTNIDRQALYLSSSDDIVWGGQSFISMEAFWCLQSDFKITRNRDQRFDSLPALLSEKPKTVKLVVYMLCDRGTLKTKVKSHFSQHPRFLLLLKKTYRLLKKTKSILKGK